MYHTTLETLFGSRDLLASLDRMSDSESRQICLIPFGSLKSALTIFSTANFPYKKLNTVQIRQTLGWFELETFERESGKRLARGEFLVYKMPGYHYAYLLIYIGETDFFHRALRPFIEAYRRHIILSFVKSNELISLITDYQESNDIDKVIITRATQRIRYHDERRMTSMTWNNSSLQEALDWLNENDGFFKSVQFKALRNHQEVTNSYLDRRGTMRVHKHFSRLFQAVTVPTLELLEHYITLFNKRGRRESRTLDVRPLEINFGREVFAQKENHGLFIKMLQWLPETSVSVLHGNPYIHVSLIDYLDGSTYELWVLDRQQLLIVPQLNSTITSLQRVVNHIFDYYAEGQVENHEN